MTESTDLPTIEELERSLGRGMTPEELAMAQRARGIEPDPYDLPLPAFFQEMVDQLLAADESRRATLGLVDLAEVMRGEDTEPTMLVPDLVVERDHALWFGPKESLKTWVALYAAAAVMAQRKTVVWVDKEMGRRNIANRLRIMGVPAEAVEDYLVYCEYPTLDCSRESRALWEAMLREFAPAMIVVDAQTEVLADAGLNEN